MKREKIYNHEGTKKQNKKKKKAFTGGAVARVVTKCINIILIV